MHEFGHILAARYYGIKCYKVELGFMGGAAYINPHDLRKGKIELFVTVCGPLINVVITILLYWFIETATILNYSDANFITKLFIINNLMLCFNLLPIFPLDGGRIVRSLLSLRLNHRFATNITYYISLAFGGAAICYGLIHQIYMMVVICGLMLIFAYAEKRMVGQQSDLDYNDFVRRFNEIVNNKDKL